MNRISIRLVIVPCVLIVFGPAIARSQQVSGPSQPRSRTDRGNQTVSGQWTYRSFRSTPELSDPNSPLSTLLFGQGELNLSIADGNRLTGTLGGTGWQLRLDGTLEQGPPVTIRFQGTGTIGGETWVYDYLGYLVPDWPNGVDQRRAIIGSIVRTAPHSGGAAPAGYVAQWIAVSQHEANVDSSAEDSAADEALKTSSYRARLLQQFFEEGRHDAERQKNTRDSEATNGTARSVSPTAADAVSPIELTVDYATHAIGNDSVRLRCYNGAPVGPTIRVKAGETLHLRLRNKLPVEPTTSHLINSHHQWNTTNLHFHGLHVAPQGTPSAESDNVLLELAPTSAPAGTVQDYAVQIPATHAAGTFWYHAHKHGAVAAQVSSGMAGALIVERDDATHNLDSIPAVVAAGEEIMLLQQVPYLKPAGSALGHIEQSADGSGTNEASMFGPTAWQNRRRYVTVNGERIPTLTLAPGAVRRLRLIHTGQREEMVLRIVRAPGTSGPGDTSIDFHEIAADGLPLGERRQRDRLSLYPGYRSDVLVQPSNATTGEFHLIDERAPGGTGADGSPEPLRLVARIRVSGTPVQMSMPTDAELAPHRLPAPTGPVAAEQHAYYGIVAGVGAQFFISRADVPIGQTPTGQEYNPTDPRVLSLGETHRWNVGARNTAGITAVHPFHIHTNPFFVEEVRNAANQIVTGAELGGPTWRDTLAMKQGYTYRLLTTYEDFTGDFVNHCHILDHEDNGMMELVRIASTTPSPAPVSGVDANAAGRRLISESLPETRGQPTTLFFVKGSFCPHCMQQVSAMSEALVGANCRVCVISASTTSDLANFPDLPYTLIADPHQRLFAKFGVMEQEQPLHGTIVLDASGVEKLRRTGAEPFLDTGAILAALADVSRRVVIEVRSPSVGDDYVTWAPTECQARVEGGDPAGPDLTIVLTNDDPATTPTAGNLAFATVVSSGQTATDSTITLNLPQSGEPRSFYIAGTKASELTDASLADGGRDAVVEARLDSATGALVGSHAVMVRVRRDASVINQLERDEYIDAIATVKGSGMHEQFVAMHTIATGRSPGANWPDQAHGNAGFLPWHRAFLLHYERELQKTHPHVALHYWREDQVSDVFVRTFMGANTIGFGEVNVDFGAAADGNPLWGWNIGGVALHRNATDRSNLSWCKLQSSVISPTDYRSPLNNFSNGLEGNPHNAGHGWVGGWMGDCRTSPRDPIFFLFHCDIDRLWAQWQWKHNRFGTDGSDPKHYRPNGSFSAGSSTPLGHHLLDTMWPWDQVTGPGTADPNDNRPSNAPESPFPASTVPGIWPSGPGNPQSATMIDYLGIGGTGMDLGFCYDDAPFGVSTADTGGAPGSHEDGISILRDRNQPWVERLRAAEELAGGVRLDDVEPLINVLADAKESDELRIATLRTLVGSDDQQWIAAARSIVESNDQSGERLRHEIVRQFEAFLFSSKHEHTTSDIHDALRNLISSQEPSSVRIAAATALAIHDDGTMLEQLREGLRTSDESVLPRAVAARLVAIAAPGQNHDVLRRLIVPGEPEETRIAALLSLGTDDESSQLRQELALNRTESAAIREAALRSVLFGDGDLVKVAERLLLDETEDPTLRQTAAAAIGLYATYNQARLDARALEGLDQSLARLGAADGALRAAVEQARARIARIAGRKK